MTVIKPEEVKNIEQPNVQALLNQFKNRNEMNVIDVAEVISKLITTLSVDHNSGRPKIYAISGGHLGELLGIGKGVVSQYMSVWNMPPETKQFLKNYNLSLINAYHVSRSKGKDEAETISLQKKIIVEKSTPSTSNSGKRTDILLHTINETIMVLNGVVSSHNIPTTSFKKNILTNDKSSLEEVAKDFIYNIDQCVDYLYPRIKMLPFLKEKVIFLGKMLEYNDTKICNLEIARDCIEKHIESLSREIVLIEAEQRLPHINSLFMMRDNLIKNV